MAESSGTRRKAIVEPDIAVTPVVLATFTARYSHCSLALRTLQANLGRLSASARILEFDIHASPLACAETILALDPRMVCLSAHVWNIEQVRSLASILRRVRPDIFLVAGGPELSGDLRGESLLDTADVLVRGEGEVFLRELCESFFGARPVLRSASEVTEAGEVRDGYRILAGLGSQAVERAAMTGSRCVVVDCLPPDPADLELPYRYYSDEDIANRVIYVETGRGCPFLCAYCMSAGEGLRFFDLDKVLPEFGRLLERGARRFKFVDRSFNVAPLRRTLRILDFFLERYVEGLVLHLELAPLPLPRLLAGRLKQFPQGTLHIEVGVQSMDEAVLSRVGRTIAPERVESLLRFLVEETGADVHADLIVGLPGQTLEVFASDFDRVFSTGAHEIQVNLLKRLKGSRMDRGLNAAGPAGVDGPIFDDRPPYVFLRGPDLSFEEARRLWRFGRFFELVMNRRPFPAVARLVCRGPSPFDDFLNLSEGLWRLFGRAHAISRDRLGEAIWKVLAERGDPGREVVLAAFEEDYSSGSGRGRRPRWLREAGVCGVRFSPGGPGGL